MSDNPHISTRDHPGDYDAFETAKPDEPIFTLQGGDPIAPLIVMGWAWFARKHARKLRNEGKEQEADKWLRKASSAEHVAWAMKDYQKGVQAVPGERASYNDMQGIAAGDGIGRAEVRKVLIQGVTVLQNALGTSNDLRETLAGLGLDALAMGGAGDGQAAMDGIGQAVDLLRTAAADIEPRRAGERS